MNAEQKTESGPRATRMSFVWGMLLCLGGLECARTPRAEQVPPRKSATAPVNTPHPVEQTSSPPADELESEEGRDVSPVIGETPAVPSSLALVDPGPMHPRSAQQGDGVFRDFFSKTFDPDWDKRVVSDVSEGYGHDWVRRIVIHPHPASRFQSMVLAAFDLQAVGIAHVPGAEDVADVGRKDLLSKAGLVPPAMLDKLLAVFNGGFQPRHGRWGMWSLGQQLIPPREDACTVAILKDGSVSIAPWPKLASRKDEIVAYRQTPPCLVEDGTIHPKLQRGDRGPWAGQQAHRKTRRRSVIGISRDGKTLFMGLGTETEPETLAAGILFAGAQSAAQLDINWNWTRLFLFEPGRGESSPVYLGSLVSDMVKDKGEYVTRPAARGFFFVYRRDVPHVFPEPSP